MGGVGDIAVDGPLPLFSLSLSFCPFNEREAGTILDYMLVLAKTTRGCGRYLCAQQDLLISVMLLLTSSTIS